MNRIVTTGIVLRRINYGEADRIITYITPDMGKISLIAKGTRKQKSKLAGSIELFGESQLTFMIGRGDIGNLMSARLISNYGNIVKDLSRTNVAYRAIKLINKHLESSSGGEFYELVRESYIDLNGIIDIRIIEIWFELNFLAITGHQPKLSVQSVSDNAMNFDFNMDSMEFTISDNGKYTRNDIKFLRLALSHKPILLSQIQSSNSTLERLSELLPLVMRTNGFEY
ncbi:MAG TPA: DNA repair protein RecO [Candidatus Dormibacteraeota bacterium]|nr:DNA repair protein RecO [Candidatus Dormibacteraeota bacterium]